MKKIALFGATGQTGQQFLTKALVNGYQVRALVRDVSKVNQQSKNLTIIQGDVLNYNEVLSALTDCDIVVSLFGHVKDSPEWLQTNGTKNIIAAMKQLGIKKIISLSGGGLPFPEKDEPKFIDKTIRFVMKIIVPKVLNDAVEHHKVLVNSNQDWLIVRGARLVNKPSNGNYRVGWVGVNAGTETSREDLASFIENQINNDQFLYQMPFVSS